jgi:hypothetical protein
MNTSISFPYAIDPVGTVTNTVTVTKLYLDRVVTLLSTNVGQRPMNPTYGVDWSTSLFENDGNFSAAVSQAIKVAIATWIPEVSVISISITNDELNGINTVSLGVQLPDDTVANLTINPGLFTYDGTVTRI